MKIVQIVTRSDNIGGAQVHVKDLSLALKGRGCRVWVLAGGEGPFIDELAECGIQVWTIKNLIRPVNPYRDWRALWEIRRVLMILQPDLVATHTSKAGWLGRAAAWSLGIPGIYTVHGWSFIQGAQGFSRKLYTMAERIAGCISSGIITVAYHDRRFCLENGLARPDKIFTVHNGIADVAYCSPEQNVYTPRFIMTARMETPKNHTFLLQAFASMTECDWRLDLVGDGPLLNTVKHRVENLGLALKVRLLGARRDVPRLLGNVQCFILISDMEGLPISILEAMRAGLPIIASDVGGVAEAVEDGVNGFLIPKGDMEALRDRIARIIDSPGLRVKMGLSSREKYLKKFRLDDMAHRTFAVYENSIRMRKKRDTPLQNSEKRSFHWQE